MKVFLAASRSLRWSAGALLLALLIPCAQLRAENRHVEKRVAPMYPELARRMHITGVVKVSATVAADGTVKDVKAQSGNQMLVTAAEEAVRQWKFASADATSSESVEVTFSASN